MTAFSSVISVARPHAVALAVAWRRLASAKVSVAGWPVAKWPKTAKVSGMALADAIGHHVAACGVAGAGWRESGGARRK
jgi:hypothetical protein